MDEGTLIESLRAGDEASFRAVVRTHGDAVYSFLVHLSGDRELARELLQQTWLALAAQARRLPPGTTVRPWLFTVARNAFWSHLRWSRLDVLRLAELALWRRDEAHHRSPDVEAETNQAGARVQQGLAQLPPKYREALLLVGVEGFEPTEAAAMLKVTPEAFRQRLSRAREALRVILGEAA